MEEQAATRIVVRMGDQFKHTDKLEALLCVFYRQPKEKRANVVRRIKFDALKNAAEQECPSQNAFDRYVQRAGEFWYRAANWHDLDDEEQTVPAIQCRGWEKGEGANGGRLAR